MNEYANLVAAHGEALLRTLRAPSWYERKAAQIEQDRLYRRMIEMETHLRKVGQITHTAPVSGSASDLVR